MHRIFRKVFQAQNFLQTDAFAHRDFYTQTLLHTEVFTHRSFYTQTCLHTDASTHRSFYTQTLLHTNAFTHRRFYTQTVLHTDAFTHKYFDTQALSENRHFYTQTLLHRLFYTQKLLHTNTFTHRHFYTQHTEAFTQTRLHTEEIAILPQFLAIERHFVRKRCAGRLESQIYISFWRSNVISCERVARDDLNRNVTSVFGDRISFRVKGLRRTTWIAILPQFLAIERHFVRKGCAGHFEEKAGTSGGKRIDFDCSMVATFDACCRDGGTVRNKPLRTKARIKAWSLHNAASGNALQVSLQTRAFLHHFSPLPKPHACDSEGILNWLCTSGKVAASLVHFGRRLPNSRKLDALGRRACLQPAAGHSFQAVVNQNKLLSGFCTMNNLPWMKHCPKISAAKEYKMFAAPTCNKSNPLRVDSPSGSSNDLDGLGGFRRDVNVPGRTCRSTRRHHIDGFNSRVPYPIQHGLLILQFGQVQRDYTHYKEPAERVLPTANWICKTMSLEARTHSSSPSKNLQHYSVRGSETIQIHSKSVLALFGHVLFVGRVERMRLEAIRLEARVPALLASAPCWSVRAALCLCCLCLPHLWCHEVPHQNPADSIWVCLPLSYHGHNHSLCSSAHHAH